VAADFIDLKSPFTVGHSRGVAELACAAAAELGLPTDEVDALRRAAWLHDFGRTAVSNAIWDKPGPLTRAERDRIELHPLLSEQMLRRSPGLSSVQAISCLHHERVDGSGYAKGVGAAAQPTVARVLAVADRYHDLVEHRAYRPALSAEQAAVEVRRRVDAGRFDAETAEAVLHAAGHSRPADSARPSGLTQRELEVLRLAVQGLTMRAIASKLEVSPKTVDTHIQHIYNKTGVSTRGALALFAVERGLLSR
jgi:HD-GYP domain-containing protein (c-di-GMP phosphodiesterase class II)